MAIFNRCCCFKLKTGCLIFGILGIIISLIELGFVIHGLVTLGVARDEELIQYAKELKDIDLNDHPKEVSDIIEEFQEVMKQLKNELGIEDLELFYKATLARCIINLLLNLISLVTNSLLIYGIQQAKYKYIVPTLVWNPINVGIEIIEIIVIISLFNIDYISIIIGMSVYAFISLLCWLCVFSHWQQVKVMVGAPERMEM
eukprot:TRINITY_DN12229_c0_g1_i1.p1 TRINITY_DN12229_c0_g1~~TRINITY_DN12229_c0_g1_i1.p1  ORF type:complete len:201 (+),score=59.79 TRINITY_DN12229_c0_g1_i1:53-655(+)